MIFYYENSHYFNNLWSYFSMKLKFIQYEEKEKYHNFTHLARDYTSSHPISTKRKNEDMRNRGDQHQEQEKVNEGN